MFHKCAVSIPSQRSGVLRQRGAGLDNSANKDGNAQEHPLTAASKPAVRPDFTTRAFRSGGPMK
jgi:hypothetical protein